MTLRPETEAMSTSKYNWLTTMKTNLIIREKTTEGIKAKLTSTQKQTTKKQTTQIRSTSGVITSEYPIVNRTESERKTTFRQLSNQRQTTIKQKFQMQTKLSKET